MKAQASVIFLLAATIIITNSCTSGKKADAAAPAEKVGSNNLEVVLTTAEQQQVGVEVRPAEMRSVPEILHVTGRLALNENRTWRVGAVTDGRIMSVLANPGDIVHAGQVLARMHSHDIHEGRAMYQKAVADLSNARQNEAYALKARDREKRLFGLKAASTAQVESAENALKAAQTATANAESEVERTRRHLTDFLDVDLKDGNTEDGDMIPIKAPANGVVLSRSVTPGTVLQPSAEAFVLSDLGTLWMIAAVSEEYLAKLKPGMSVQVFVRAYANEPFDATIQHIGEVLDPTTRTVMVRIAVPNSQNKLKPEMYAIGDIALGGSGAGIFVHEGATHEVNGQKSVFVRTQPDRFEVRPVETGRTIEGSLQVTNGLKAGDYVVTKGSFVLKSQLMKSSLSEGE